MFKLGTYLTNFLRQTSQLVNVSRASFNYVVIDLPNVKVTFFI